MTSGTAFAWRKLSLKKMLPAIWFAANSNKGKAALQLSRELGAHYKTAWVLLMKLQRYDRLRGGLQLREHALEIEKPVDALKQMIGRHVIIEAEIVKQSRRFGLNLIIVPPSCVEAARWNDGSQGRATAD